MFSVKNTSISGQMISCQVFPPSPSSKLPILTMVVDYLKTFWGIDRGVFWILPPKHLILEICLDNSRTCRWRERAGDWKHFLGSISRRWSSSFTSPKPNFHIVMADKWLGKYLIGNESKPNLGSFPGHHQEDGADLTAEKPSFRKSKTLWGLRTVKGTRFYTVFY